jgi:hypothetical protein
MFKRLTNFLNRVFEHATPDDLPAVWSEKNIF